MKKRHKDYYYKRAKSEGFRSRASYKLLQIQERYHIIRQNDVVIDLGAAPGGWLQVIRSLKAKAIAVDRQQIAPLEGVVFIKADITAADTVEKIHRVATQVDVVISDAAPNLSGVWSLDHARSISLAQSALRVAEQTLKPGGNFLVKVFQGDMFNAFEQEVSSFFSFVHAFNPKASRKQSAEIYLIGKRFLRQRRNI